MAIPTSLAWNVEALHGAIAREDVFEYSGFYVMSSWHAVGSRRSFVKNPTRTVASARHRFVKDVIVFPKREHVVLHRWKINLRGYIAVCHQFSSSLAVNYQGHRLVTLISRDEVIFRPFPRYHPC